MAVGLPFTSAHVSSFAERAAELERQGEDLQDPHTLIRAARLYTLAVRIADDIDQRPAEPFTGADLARVRDELRSLATNEAQAGGQADYGDLVRARLSHDMTRAFREVALRIEQRLGIEPIRREPDARPGA
jgi:hypothetical protein